VEIQTDKGRYSFAYAELGTIWTHIAPAWRKAGFFWVSDVQTGERGPKLVTRIGHKSGQWMESDFTLPNIANTKQFAGEITYARRYSFSMMMGLASQEDADEMPAGNQQGNGRNKHQRHQEQPQASHTSPKPAAATQNQSTGAGKQPQAGARIPAATPAGSGGQSATQAPAASHPGQKEREEIVELCASNHWPAERVPEYLKIVHHVQRLDQLTMEQYAELKKVISGPATFEEVMELVKPKPGDFGYTGPAEPGSGG
jgi:hypothetical protein